MHSQHVEMTTSHNIYIQVHCQLALLYDQIINILRRSSAVKLENSYTINRGRLHKFTDQTIR